jgi:opacity protein-like surface antigen
LLSTVLVWFSFCAHAVVFVSPESHDLPDYAISSPFVATLSVGPVWTQAGNTQTFLLAPGILKTFKAQKHTHALADGELFIGQQRQLRGVFQGQFGLAVATTARANLSGYIWDDADPAFQTYAYHYTIQHTHVAVKGKVLVNNSLPVTPWVSGSLGVGFNKSTEYTNTPLIFPALVMPNFTSHTRTAFTYTLGAGVQRAFTDHLQAGIGYEFADWGASQLYPALGQTLGTGLRLNHLYTNGLMFNITYIA